MNRVSTDRGICKFFILGKCNRDQCRWVHTNNKCNECDTYTEHKLCYKCNKKNRLAKKLAYEKKLSEQGYECVNYQTCNGYTLRGDYCQECFKDVESYVMGPCRNKECDNRVVGGRGYCKYCSKN